MLIRNLTSKKQKLEVRELAGYRNVYDLYVTPGSTTDLDRFLVVVDPDKYAGIFEFDGVSPTPVAQVVEKKEVAPQVKEEPTPLVEPEVSVEEKKEEPEAFICDICGAEFASARGLAAHKNKAHAE